MLKTLSSNLSSNFTIKKVTDSEGNNVVSDTNGYVNGNAKTKNLSKAKSIEQLAKS